MRTLALILVALSLVVGVLGAVTAYLPRTSLPDEALVGLHLTAAAGAKIENGRRAAIADSGAHVTPELLAELRAAGVERIRVKEFSFARWDRWWVFALGAGGLLASGLVLRRGRVVSPMVVATDQAAASPERALTDLREGLASVRREAVSAADDRSRLQLIMQRVADLQAGPIASFIAARAALVARLGIAGYAQLMDRFAAAERQANRAWSAAADDDVAEALECLERAEALAGEADGRLRSSGR